jgi:5-methylcytosine-specific restriction endonuclease McrA
MGGDKSVRKRVKLVRYNGVFYHPNFFKRAQYCIKRAKYTCQHCGIKRGEEYITKGGNTDKAVIQAAHVNHDPTKARAKLIALCKPCHLKYDGPMHGEKAGKTKGRKKVQKQIDAGQLTFNWKIKGSKVA